ncbi:DNA-3-methyladenine glycosylase family protein [Natronoarchaeum sp. GCM10025703]|uniref:DNA-3-methyladenine glycosylase family protein n=1 Tax=unclassified Natronoarchaeum TaxID=2620183 RepID=UPI003615D43F
MPTGAIPTASLAGGMDLHLTLESGQSYLWRREDGRMYENATEGSPWYYTVVDGEVVRVRQTESAIEWHASTEAEPLVRELLRLDDDLPEIFGAAPDEQILEAAYEYARGLRLVADPVFPTLISFILSQQMRVERIHSMTTTLAREYGAEVEFDGQTYRAFPTPEELATASESELRDFALGYRAPYVVRTAEMVADGDAHPNEALGLSYEDARESLTRFVGVGDKVADCVLLFSLGYLEAVPLDTWIRTAIEDHFPDCDCGNYAETSRAIRQRFGVGDGDDYAGYVQTYVFHYLRTRE